MFWYHYPNISGSSETFMPIEKLLKLQQVREYNKVIKKDRNLISTVYALRGFLNIITNRDTVSNKTTGSFVEIFRLLLQ